MRQVCCPGMITQRLVANCMTAALAFPWRAVASVGLMSLLRTSCERVGRPRLAAPFYQARKPAAAFSKRDWAYPPAAGAPNSCSAASPLPATPGLAVSGVLAGPADASSGPNSR
jgi:hypothetical protein